MKTKYLIFIFVILVTACTTGKESMKSKKENIGQIKKYYNTIPSLNLPLGDSFDNVIDNPAFTIMPKELYPMFGIQEYNSLGNIEWAKIENNQAYLLVLIYTYEEWGDTVLTLYTISDTDKIIDSLELETARDEMVDNKLGCRATVYDISKDMIITISDILTTDGKREIKEVNNYCINKDGTFKQK